MSARVERAGETPSSAPARMAARGGRQEAPFWPAVGAILAKDLKQQWRSPASTLATATYALLVVLVLGFGWASRQEAAQTWPAGLWLSLVFAGTAGMYRSAAMEDAWGGWTGLLLAPVPRTAVFTAKLLANWLYVTALQALIQATLALLVGGPVAAVAVRAPFAAVSLLAGLGYAAVGTVLALFSVGTELGEVFLGVLLLPLLAPVILGAMSATGILVAGGGWPDVAAWVRLLAAFDVTFVAAAWLLFEVTSQGEA